MNGVDDVEFKVAEKNKSWEDTPVLMTLTLIHLNNISGVARILSKLYGAEVRWNWTWSEQGHYVKEQ